MNKLTWPAPAKLNLFLHITGRRDDGYHTLQTVFQFIDRCDQLTFSIRDDGVIRRISDIPGVPPQQDLTVRAAGLLQQHSGCPLGVDIEIDKVLPMGGGLGGGSSDAATTLVALNYMWQLGLPEAQLAELGLGLGADVPIFVYGKAAWAEGVGECLTPVDPVKPWYLVVVPPCHVSTAEIFNDPELTRDCNSMKIPAFLAGQASNVCEPVVTKHYPEVAEALDWLRQFGPAKMTGTGACVFVPFERQQQAQAAIQKMPKTWQGFVAKGMNNSPLCTKMAALKDG